MWAKSRLSGRLLALRHSPAEKATLALGFPARIFCAFALFLPFMQGENRWSAVENTKRIQGFHVRNGLAQSLLIFL